MISLEERKDILDDEVEILEDQGWTVVSRTDTTCFLTKEAKGLRFLTVIMAFLTSFVYFERRKHHKTRTVEISAEGEIIRSWIKL